MAVIGDLLAERTNLKGPVVAHLQRLVSSWGTLSDLCFADLLLFAPALGPEDSFVVIGQVRPTTSQTLHLEDLIGTVMDVEQRQAVARAWRLGSVVEGEVSIPSRSERGRLVCIPVRWQGELVAIMTRESALLVGRRPGELERVYVEVFYRLARMISAGEFPFPTDDETPGGAPRVGDGVVVLDSSARVDYASPNAVNALHRMGLSTGTAGIRLDEAGIDQHVVDLAFQTHLPATQEVLAGPDVAVIIRCVPLLDHGVVTGAVVLLRDVTDLRRLDRLLLSKDAAIREVHHRVKNNLQTISSLLRLQSRRLPQSDARHALEESERRVRSIALVHEILSRDTTDQVDFNDILPSLVRMAEDLGDPDRPLHITYSGEAGLLQAAVATPLAVVLTELLQNAAEHAFPDETTDDAVTGTEILVDVDLRRSTDELQVTVRDNGVGLPPGFSIEETTSLGLSIVRGLVGSQMGGIIAMHTDGGTVVSLRVPIDQSADDLENL
ncbi:MAG: sensor histidine kinase [Actinomycetota bacterium]|nr:sensor histidine kinase [Actinomycetota bacterium]